MVILLFLIFGLSSGSLLPDGVKLCHRSDANFAKCLAKNMGDALPYFANGYKNLNIPALEPLFIEALEIQGEGSQSVSVDQKYRNIKVYGNSNSSFEKYFEVDLDKGCKWSTDVFSPVIRMEADYEIKGQLLVFPINSKGKCNITQINVTNRHTMTCEKYTKKNETYLRVIDYTMLFTVENIIFDFEGLFPANEQIAKEIQKTINDNPLSIFNEVKGGVEKAFSFVFMQYMNNVLSKIPFKEIFLD